MSRDIGSYISTNLIMKIMTAFCNSAIESRRLKTFIAFSGADLAREAPNPLNWWGLGAGLGINYTPRFRKAVTYYQLAVKDRDIAS